MLKFFLHLLVHFPFGSQLFYTKTKAGVVDTSMIDFCFAKGDMGTISGTFSIDSAQTFIIRELYRILLFLCFTVQKISVMKY